MRGGQGPSRTVEQWKKIYTLMGMNINEDGRHNSGIYDGINLGQYELSAMNCILWDKRVARKSKQIFTGLQKNCYIMWFGNVTCMKNKNYWQCKWIFGDHQLKY
jgi:hypothetical protein